MSIMRASIVLSVSLAACHIARSATASDLSETCQKARTAITNKGKWEGKRPDDIYAVGQCEGFLQGWIEGIDGTILNGEDGLVSVSVKRDQIKSTWDVAEALIQDLKENPLDSGKPVDSVLQAVLLSNGLITFSPVTSAGATPSTYQTSSVKTREDAKVPAALWLNSPPDPAVRNPDDDLSEKEHETCFLRRCPKTSPEEL